MIKKYKDAFLYSLLTLVVMQPILDLVWLNNGSIPEIFGFTIPTLIRFAFVIVLGILSLLIVKFNKKYFAWVAYIIVIIVYFIFHHINAQNFYSLIPGDFQYSLMGELFYLIRMLIPIGIMYFTYHSDITEKHFTNAVLTVSLFISILNIVTNLMKIALGSYTDLPIEGNFIEWFYYAGSYVYTQIAAKGLFYSSIISTTQVLLLPYLVYKWVDTKKMIFLVTILLQGLSMFIFGTKATSFSVIIVFAVMLACYLFCIIIKKEYRFKSWILISLIILLLSSIYVYQYSPCAVRINFDKEYSASIDEDDPVVSEQNKKYHISEDDPEGVIEFITDNYKYISIKEQFLFESYNYKYDPVFWYHILDKAVPSQRMQNRFIQEKMLNRVKEINDNPLDDYLGIGYTRTSHIYNLERDFKYQYYSSGIIGSVLLVGPYIFILIGIMIYMLWKFKERFTLKNCSFCLGFGLTYFVAYYSGNVMETLGITIIIGFVCGYAIKVNMTNKKLRHPIN